MGVVFALKGNGPTGFGHNSTAEDVARDLSLSGKTILITGCTSGLGEEASRVLSLRGARVLGAARTQANADAACARLPNKGIGYACELSDPTSVRNCVSAVKRDGHRLDAIICNAGIMALPERRLAHGIELQFFTNHIGHFILVNGLLDALADDARVVVLSSEAHKRAPKGGIMFDDLAAERSYGPWANYGQSKFANLLFAKELQRRFAGSTKTAYAVHPGVIHTNLARSMSSAAQIAMKAIGPLFLKSIPQGAATQVFAAVHPKALPLAGEYLADCNVKRPDPLAEDVALAQRLWRVTEEIVGTL